MALLHAVRRRNRRAPPLHSYRVGDPLPPGLIFSRASDARYTDQAGVIQAVGNNVARDAHHLYDTSGVQHRALLLEGQRTNAWLNSEQVQLWSRINATVTVDVATAPDGTSTADRVAYSGTTADWDIVHQGAFTGTYTWSAWLRTEDGSTKTVYVTWGAPDAAKRVALTVDGTWKRYTATVTPSLENVHLGNHNTLTPAGWSAFNLLVWRTQLEPGPFASSGIPTTSATVTRAADLLSFDFTAPPQEMTVYCRFVEQGTAKLGGGARLFQISGPDANPRLLATSNGSGYDAVLATSAGSVSVSTAGGAVGDLIELRLVLHQDGRLLAGLSINGGAESVTALSGALALPVAWSGQQLWLGRNGSDGSAHGFNAYTHTRIERGVRTLAEMRAKAGVS